MELQVATMPFVGLHLARRTLGWSANAESATAPSGAAVAQQATSAIACLFESVLKGLPGDTDERSRTEVRGALLRMATTLCLANLNSWDGDFTVCEADSGEVLIEFAQGRGRLGFAFEIQFEKTTWFATRVGGEAPLLVSGLVGAPFWRDFTGLWRKVFSAPQATDSEPAEKPFADIALRGLRKESWAKLTSDRSRHLIASEAFWPNFKPQKPRRDGGFDASINFHDRDEALELLAADQGNAAHGIAAFPSSIVRQADETCYPPIITGRVFLERAVLEANPFHGNVVYGGSLDQHIVRGIAGYIATSAKMHGR